MLAAKYGHKDVVELLINRGANIMARDNNGWTALILSAKYGHKDVVELLINIGANIEARNNYGETSLMLAACNGYKEVIELMVGRGADIEARNNSGDTALILSFSFDKKNIAKILLDNGRKEALELLINYGAEIMARNNYGKTALMHAIEVNRSKECTKLLIEAKSDLLEFFDILENNTKIDFLNCIPSGVVMTETQITDLHALGIREEDLSSNGVVSFELNIIRASKVLYLYANKDIVAEIISYTINDCRIKLLYSILYDKATKRDLFLVGKKQKPKISIKKQDKGGFFTKYLNFFSDCTNLLG